MMDRKPLTLDEAGAEAMAKAAMNKSVKPPRDLVEKLEQVGPEQVIDGMELCPQCTGLSPGISADGETVIHCSTCHDVHAVTVEAANEYRKAVAARHGDAKERS
jgi:hypothetical protein